MDTCRREHWLWSWESNCWVEVEGVDGFGVEMADFEIVDSTDLELSTFFYSIAFCIKKFVINLLGACLNTGLGAIVLLGNTILAESSELREARLSDPLPFAP
jgi:hypothetical protein